MTETRYAPVYLGLGTNVGDRESQLAAARRRVADLPSTELRATSPIVETEALGPPQGRFLNQVIEIATGSTPEELLVRLRAIEESLGRRRDERWGPRTIDLDILDFAGRVSNRPELTLPHPRLRERPFVLAPWAALAPEHRVALDGSEGTPVKTLWERCRHESARDGSMQGAVRPGGIVGWWTP